MFFVKSLIGGIMGIKKLLLYNVFLFINYSFEENFWLNFIYLWVELVNIGSYI